VPRVDHRLLSFAGGIQSSLWHVESQVGTVSHSVLSFLRLIDSIGFVGNSIDKVDEPCPRFIDLQ
jgi:hypothetical protein